MSLVRINDFLKIELDKAELKKQILYFNKYYHDRFQPDQGTEEILSLIKQYNPGGRWLDVGCGSTTLFWSLLTKEISEITCADFSMEALKVLFDFINSHSVPKCYEDIMKLYGIHPNVLYENKKKIKNMYCFDAFNQWPNELCSNRYDYVTQFGVFGLASNIKTYKRCFKYMKQAVALNGICIGANWVLSSAYADKREHNNSFITTDLIREACEENGFAILSVGEKKIKNDADYDRVIYWAVQN